MLESFKKSKERTSHLRSFEDKCVISMFVHVNLRCVIIIYYGKGRVEIKLGVSKNSGIPKSSILIWFSLINHPFWGKTPYFWKHPHHEMFVKQIRPLGGCLTLHPDGLVGGILSRFRNLEVSQSLSPKAYLGVEVEKNGLEITKLIQDSIKDTSQIFEGKTFLFSGFHLVKIHWWFFGWRNVFGMMVRS